MSQNLSLPYHFFSLALLSVPVAQFGLIWFGIAFGMQSCFGILFSSIYMCIGLHIIFSTTLQKGQQSSSKSEFYSLAADHAISCTILRKFRWTRSWNGTLIRGKSERVQSTKRNKIIKYSTVHNIITNGTVLHETSKSHLIWIPLQP